MLLAHAAPRFHRLGYHSVSLADVAADAGVTAPAVYRHFASKEELLKSTITSGLDLVEAAAQANLTGSLMDLMAAVADVGLERPDLWVLLQREARFLGAEHLRAVQAQFERLVLLLVGRLRQERPGIAVVDARLLVAGATSVLSTPSVFRLSGGRQKQRHELAGAAEAVLRTRLAGSKQVRRQVRPAVTSGPENRRSELLHPAIELFFERGYVGVTLDDIGAAVGIAGPSIYHHFTTKVDLLVAAFDQALALLRSTQRTEDNDLPELVRRYVLFCLENRALAGVYVSEAVNLPPDVRRTISTFLDEQVGKWSLALLVIDPTLDRPAARVRVQAVLTMISDLVRLGHFHVRPGITRDVWLMAMAALVQG